MPGGAPIPEGEERRLQALYSYQVLDTEPEPQFDRVTALASKVLGAPVALVSLVDRDRQWFKSAWGIDAIQTPREDAICAYTILADDVFVVPDTTQDERFATNPLVAGKPHIRSYAGAPLITSDGSRIGTLCVVFFEATALPPSALAQLRVLASLVVDLLEQRRELLVAEAARMQADAASEAKSHFLASVSHEIRTLLNSVLGVAGALGNTELDASQREMIEVINLSGRDLTTIVNDLLDLAKVESRQLELEETDFHIEELASGVERLFAHMARARDLDFSVTVAPEAVGRYRGDPTRIRQVLDNLVSNALKFTSAGEIAVHVERRASDDDGRPCLLFTVRDTGAGISREYIERLFSPFSQEHVSIARRHGGTGLGLAICRQLCSLMDGWIDVESTLGAGSAFYFCVPLARIDEAAAISHAPTEDHDETSRRSAADARRALRVLAAEDNAHNRFALSAILAQAGVDVDFVENGRAAVTAWERGDYDLVLMDMNMPVLDGAETVRRIRAIENRTGLPRTPIIALTAEVMPHQVEEHLKAGVDRHVAKPIEPAALFSRIREVFEA